MNRTVAVVLPYRDRFAHWKQFIQALGTNAKHAARRGLRFRVYVIEQANKELFNRGWLFNVGFAIATRGGDSQVDCVVIHDVDMLPTETVDYGWCEVPFILSSELPCWKGRTPYLHYVGGVVSMNPAHWRVVNGFSNEYFGWGGEDDDLFWRLYHNKLLTGTCRPFCDEYKPTAQAILRPPPGGGRFVCLNDKDHTQRVEPKDKQSIMQRLRKLEAGHHLWKTEGLSSLRFKELGIRNETQSAMKVFWVRATYEDKRKDEKSMFDKSGDAQRKGK